MNFNVHYMYIVLFVVFGCLHLCVVPKQCERKYGNDRYFYTFPEPDLFSTSLA